ncbi:MAG: hypothetical protein JSW67_07390 [Candidatus Latescibacterota bacterium]|nr:MAG: hypothetical protein JSW67_07390 [Candidatus Latescibacterota bacterium]
MHFSLRRFRLLLPSTLLILSSAVDAQEVGIYFDEQAQTCVANIESFGTPVQAYVFGFVEAGTLLNGAVLRVELLPGFEMSDVELPKGRTDLEGDLTSSEGADLTLADCPVASGPILLLKFKLAYLVPGGEPADVVLELKGGTLVADSLVLQKPQLKVCDPQDPLGGDFELLESQSVLSTLNCTGDCPCTTAVSRRSWTHIKSLYRKP